MSVPDSMGPRTEAPAGAGSADPTPQIQAERDLRPTCFDDFHCLAEGCRLSCCKGWSITFNKKDYLSLKRQSGSSELNARLELLNGKPPRCDEAYTAMEKAVAESEKAAEQYSEDVQPIRELCENVIQTWSEIVEEIRDWSKVDRFFLDRAREHYSKENTSRKEI